MPYEIATHQFYKIWFSKNRDQALGIENELIFIKLRKKHPKAEISLVYSSSCLSHNAKAHLNKFCSLHDIKLFDFNTDLREKIKTNSLDNTLYDIAQEEIFKVLENKGGNLAAASDITRLLEPVALLGIYSDFDVDLDFSQFEEKPIMSQAPIIIQGEADFNHSNLTTNVNNEFLAIAKTKFNTIDPNAQIKLNKIKENILKNYQNPHKALFSVFLLGSESLMQSHAILECLTHVFFETYPEATIFHFRHYIENLTLSKIFNTLPKEYCISILGKPYSPSLKEEDLAFRLGRYLKNFYNQVSIETKANNESSISENSELEIGTSELLIYKHQLYVLSVTHITGPLLLRNLINNIDEYVCPLSQESIAAFTTEINSYLACNSPFSKCIFSKNTISEQRKQNTPGKALIDLIGNCGHQSWNALGALKKVDRENAMDKAASIIQKTFKKYKANTKKLIKPVKRISITSQTNNTEPTNKKYKK